MEEGGRQRGRIPCQGETLRQRDASVSSGRHCPRDWHCSKRPSGGNTRAATCLASTTVRPRSERRGGGVDVARGEGETGTAGLRAAGKTPWVSELETNTVRSASASTVPGLCSGGGLHLWLQDVHLWPLMACLAPPGCHHHPFSPSWGFLTSGVAVSHTERRYPASSRERPVVVISARAGPVDYLQRPSPRCRRRGLIWVSLVPLYLPALCPLCEVIQF